MNSKYFLSILVLGLVLSPSLTLGEEDFNPNYLISDEEMTAYNSMNREDIEAFLDDKGGAISTLKVPDKDGDVRDIPDIISRASKEHRINPKYLLVKLQKEQSLVTENSPTQKQLDWATGYGICDSCSMNDPSLQKHRGLGTQVDSAAAIIRWYYDNYTREKWIKRANIAYSIDGNTVQPANHATAFLYTYTPHIQGNKNFWTLWQRWFDQVYPDGTLMKATGDSVVYLVKDKIKYPFKNMSALTSRFNPNLIIEVPTSELSNYETGRNISLPNYAVLKQGSKYYLLDDDMLRPFQSNDTVRQLGYHPDEIISVTYSDISHYSKGPVITATTNPQGRLVRVKENQSLYYIKDNQYFPVYDERIASVNYPQLQTEVASAITLGTLISGPKVLLKDGTLFGIEGENSIYVVEHGKKRHIVSEDVFTGLGFKWDNIVWINTFAGMAHETGQPVYLKRPVINTNVPSAEIAQVESNITYERVENGKMWSTPPKEVKYIGNKYETQINNYAIADYETGEILAGKNVDDVRPIASFTKVMTAYRLFKEGLMLQSSVSYSPNKHKATYHRYNIGVGDQVLNKDLLSAMLVSSLNTPVNMAVSSVEPNRNAFIERMNKQADDWGLDNTTFSDVTGESLETKSTARDYVTIFRKAVKNADVKKYLGTTSYAYEKVYTESDKRKNHYDTNSNKLTKKSGLPFNILASKTGYLDEAGAGLVMLVERNRDGKKFIIITMGNPNYSIRFNEPENIARWAVNNF